MNTAERELHLEALTKDFDYIFKDQGNFLDVEDLSKAKIFNSNRHFYDCRKKKTSTPPSVRIHGKLKFPKSSLKRWLLENSEL